MSTGVILMTALLPTKGHQYLIEFAKNFIDIDYKPGNRLHIIISVRDKEPTSWDNRVDALRDYDDMLVFHQHDDNDAPQNPPIFGEENFKAADDEAFWNYWRDTVLKFCKPDYIFASEPYGQAMADVLRCEFIPVDINRELFPIKGSDVRKDLFNRQDDLTEHCRRIFSRKYVLFGQESTGKTTMAKALAKKFNGQFIHEWARPYLETIGHEPTIDRMQNIIRGQAAAEYSVDALGQKLLTFYDTDLYSTIGFWKLYYPDRRLPNKLLSLASARNRDKFYLVMNPDIPFEKDVLRYGGHERETNRKYWIDLLDRFKLPYYVIQSTKHDDQLEEISNFILTKDNDGWNYRDIMTFERD